MNALAEQYEGQDFVILVFPCNQFNRQAPYDVDAPEEFLNELTYVRPGNNFQPKVTQFFSKVDVNGANEADFYTFLKGSCPPVAADFKYDMLYYEPKKTGDVYWNYEKFLIDKQGHVYTRYKMTLTNVRDVAPDIDELLSRD